MKTNCILFLVTVLLTGCAGTKYAAHPHKRGSVMSVENNTAIVCVANNESLDNGNTYDVYKVIKHPREDRGYPSTYEFKTTGSIRITHVIGNHYASATIMSGDVRPGQNILQKP